MRLACSSTTTYMLRAGAGVGNVSATLEARAFGFGAGVLDDSLLLRDIEQTGSGMSASAVRLVTSWHFAFPEFDVAAEFR